MYTHPPASLQNPLSRREFLKIGLLGFAGLVVPSWDDLARAAPLASLDPGLQGRVLEENVTVYDIPSRKGQKVKVYWRDTVIPLTGVTVDEDAASYNRIWYRIGQEGYAHSSGIQPVRTLLNEPRSELPPGGALAEVTVPFTDAYWGPGKESIFAYRYYYATTYWVIALVQDSSGNPWYRILEDKWEFIFYVPATHLRIVPESELTPLSPQVPPEAKRLEVREAEQALIAYEWNRPVFMARAATGARFRDGNYFTPPGRHITFHKRPSRHMARGNLAANGYDLPGVPWVIYFTEEGVSVHGTYWHNDFGKPRSHGCVNLTPQAAKWVYRWTLPYVPPWEQKVYEDFGTILDVI
jgi:lipoprotein-anchoring transpeptidase ErfK/SrfK